MKYLNEVKPNHICKNQNCTKGEDGARKHYYACDYCSKVQNWHSMACCVECFNEYSTQISLARKNGMNINLYPERTDMTHDQVVEMIENTPIEIVKANTINELSEHQDDIASIGLEQTIVKINDELDSKYHSKKKRL